MDLSKTVLSELQKETRRRTVLWQKKRIGRLAALLIGEQTKSTVR
jgi:hypothetical protein